MTTQHDHEDELGSAEDTADGAGRPDGDASAGTDTGAAKWQRTDGKPEYDDLADSERTAGSEESADRYGLAESGAIEDDIIVAEVISESPGQPVSSAADELAGPWSAQDATTAGGADSRSGDTGLSQEWRDIQAAFVDDPAGAVQLAANTTSAALRTLIDRLRVGQSALVNGGSSRSEPDTERLRGALREYRTLYENVDQIGRRLLQLM